MRRKFDYRYAPKKDNNEFKTGDCHKECVECVDENEGADLFPNHDLEELDEEYGDRVAKILEGE